MYLVNDIARRVDFTNIIISIKRAFASPEDIDASSSDIEFDTDLDTMYSCFLLGCMESFVCLLVDCAGLIC